MILIASMWTATSAARGDDPPPPSGPIADSEPLPPLPEGYGRTAATARLVRQPDSGSTRRALDTVPGGAGGATQPRAAENTPTASQVDASGVAATNLLMKALHAEASPIKLYGWIENSYTGNADGTPRNGSNFSVAPNRLANRWQGNQYYFILENPLETNVDYVNFGARLDTLFGNDWQFSKSYGFADRAFHDGQFSGVDLPQIALTAHLPVLTRGGVDIQGGRFYSPAGFESVQAVRRPLLSVPYLFNYTPFTLFGTLATLHLNERVNLYSGAVNGWDRWIDSNYRYSYIGGVNATSADGKTSFTSFIITGPDQLPRFAPANSPFLPTGVVTNTTIQGQRNPYYSKSIRTYMSNVVTHNWSAKFTEAAEVFFVHENDVEGLGPGGPTHVNKESAWYGAAHWYLYQVTPKVTGVFRSEIFRDQNGAAAGVPDNYYEMTVGAVYKPKPWLWFRPEVRYDWAQFHKPFDDGSRSSQLTIAFDVIVQF